MANKVIYGQLRLDNLKEYIQTGTKKDGTAYKYIPVKIVEKQEPDQRGNTHYIQLDSYYLPNKPEKNVYLGDLKTKIFGQPNVTADTQAAYGVTDDDLGF